MLDLNIKINLIEKKIKFNHAHITFIMHATSNMKHKSENLLVSLKIKNVVPVCYLSELLFAS